MENGESNRQDFPEPLDTEDPKIQEKTLVELTPLILKIARALVPGDARLREDLVQEGFLSLILASSSYDPERGPFVAFARRCVRNRMISYLRRLRPSLSLAEEDLERFSIDISPEEGIDLGLARTSLFNLLSPFEVICLEAYLYTGSNTGAAELLGWEPKKVENALTRIKGKARLVRENPFLAGSGNPSGQETDLSLQ